MLTTDHRFVAAIGCHQIHMCAEIANYSAHPTANSSSRSAALPAPFGRRHPSENVSLFRSRLSEIFFLYFSVIRHFFFDVGTRRTLGEIFVFEPFSATISFLFVEGHGVQRKIDDAGTSIAGNLFVFVFFSKEEVILDAVVIVNEGLFSSDNVCCI